MSNFQLGLAGKFKLVAVNADTGEERVVADWFDNLITDAGLNRMGTGEFGSYCLVGSGSATPTVNDTALANFIASAFIQSTSSGAAASSPYYGFESAKYRFNQGVATGNISEVAIGWSNTNSNIYSRTLIKDGSGQPITITVLPSEYLDVYHELRMYPPSTDSVSQLTIDGQLHTVTARPGLVTEGSQGFWAPYRQNGTGVDGYSYFAANPNDIVGVTSSPGRTSDISAVAQSYVNNSNKRTIILTAGLNAGNFQDGIKSIVMVSNNMGFWQFGFSPAVMKTSTATFSITVELSWARKP